MNQRTAARRSSPPPDRTAWFGAGWLERVVRATEADLADPRILADRLEVAKLRALFRTSFTHAPVGMAIVDPTGQIVIANEAFCRITGRSSEELSVSSIDDMTYSEDGERDADQRRRLLAGEMASYEIEGQLRRPDGSDVWVSARVARDDASPISVIYQVQDITEGRRRLREHVAYLIDHDLLTGLFNRRRFEQELDRQVDRQRRSGEGGAVLMLDIDEFKAVNDQFGHAAGDELLRGLSTAMRHRTRATDVLARLSGDEFALLLPGAGADEAAEVASQLLTLIRGHATVLGAERAHVTASIGVALFDDLTAVQLLALADAAMYAAKESGRNRVVIFDPRDEHHGHPHRAGEASRLRRALQDERLVVHLQPIWNLAERRVDQYELLIRLRGEGRDELIAPSGFLHVAERFGLVGEIDAWVVSQAVELISAQAALGRRVVLAVNLSGRSIGDPVVAAHIDRSLEASGIDPSCLVFELTETAAIGNFEAALELAVHLHERGCRLALDDFGAGFASFSYLKSLPFDYIKIDGDFVRGLTASATDQLLIDAIVMIARGMGKLTVAEFVQDRATSDLLLARGVDLAQGFHLGRPCPVAETFATAAASS